MRTWTRRLLIAVVAIGALTPALAHAQSAIGGVVRDTTGAVMPGVTVEAASPALIEKVRTAITDAAGAYRIENLFPGTYTVTFTLAASTRVKREGLELPSNFTATVNAEMSVGALEETVVVTGASPVVDTTSTARSQVINREMLDALPTGKTAQLAAALVPGVFMAQPGRRRRAGGEPEQHDRARLRRLADDRAARRHPAAGHVRRRLDPVVLQRAELRGDHRPDERRRGRCRRRAACASSSSRGAAATPSADRAASSTPTAAGSRARSRRSSVARGLQQGNKIDNLVDLRDRDGRQDHPGQAVVVRRGAQSDVQLARGGHVLSGRLARVTPTSTRGTSRCA